MDTGSVAPDASALPYVRSRGLQHLRIKALAVGRQNGPHQPTSIRNHGGTYVRTDARP